MTLPVRLPEFTPDSIYLDTPTYGLASAAVIEVMTESLERWRRGVATMAEYDQAVVLSRRLFSEIATRIRIASQ
jgi:hypothetical protein